MHKSTIPANNSTYLAGSILFILVPADYDAYLAGSMNFDGLPARYGSLLAGISLGLIQYGHVRLEKIVDAY